MNTDTKKLDFAKSINRLEEINRWFQNEDIDLDEGLDKLREGKALIAQCRAKLQEVENEFVKIKHEYVAEDNEIELPDEQVSTHIQNEGIANGADELEKDEIPLTLLTTVVCMAVACAARWSIRCRRGRLPSGLGRYRAQKHLTL